MRERVKVDDKVAPAVFDAAPENRATKSDSDNVSFLFSVEVIRSMLIVLAVRDKRKLGP